VRPVKPDCAIVMSRLAKTATYTLYRDDSLFRPSLYRRASIRKHSDSEQGFESLAVCSFASCTRGGTATEGFAKRARL